MTIKGDSLKKWTASEKYRNNYDHMKSEQPAKVPGGKSVEPAELIVINDISNIFTEFGELTINAFKIIIIVCMKIILKLKGKI